MKKNRFERIINLRIRHRQFLMTQMWPSKITNIKVYRPENNFSGNVPISAMCFLTTFQNSNTGFTNHFNDQIRSRGLQKFQNLFAIYSDCSLTHRLVSQRCFIRQKECWGRWILLPTIHWRQNCKCLNLPAMKLLVIVHAACERLTAGNLYPYIQS